MKINGIGAGARTGIEKKKKTAKSSGFHTLLKSSLDKVDVFEKEGREQAGGKKKADIKNVRLIKDAAHMLNRAMEQIHKNGEPDPAVVESLQHLSHHLDQIGGRTTSGESQIADVLVAVEVQRLRNW